MNWKDIGMVMNSFLPRVPTIQATRANYIVSPHSSNMRPYFPLFFYSSATFGIV